MKSHYIAMSGSSGCLPDFCEPYQEREQALEVLVELHEMGKSQNHTLRKDGYVRLAYGADYAQVTECQCNTPGIHTESGEVDWDEEEEEDA